METIEKFSEKEFKCCINYSNYQKDGYQRKFNIDFIGRIRDVLEKCRDEGDVVDLCFFPLSKDGKKEHIKDISITSVNGEYFEIEDSNNTRYFYEKPGLYYLHEILVHKPWKEMSEK